MGNHCRFFFSENVKIYFGECSLSSSKWAKYQIHIRPMQRYLLFLRRGFLMETYLKVHHDKNHSCAQKRQTFCILNAWPAVLYDKCCNFCSSVFQGSWNVPIGNKYHVIPILMLPQFFTDASKRFHCTWNHLRTWKPNVVASVPHFTTAHCTQTKCLWLTELNLSWPETEAKLLNVR